MRQSAPAMDGVSWGLLGLLSLLWGGSFFFYKILIGALPPFTVVFGRVGLAAVALICCLSSVAIRFRPRRAFGAAF